MAIASPPELICSPQAYAGKLEPPEDGHQGLLEEIPEIGVEGSRFGPEVSVFIRPNKLPQMHRRVKRVEGGLALDADAKSVNEKVYEPKAEACQILDRVKEDRPHGIILDRLYLFPLGNPYAHQRLVDAQMCPTPQPAPEPGIDLHQLGETVAHIDFLFYIRGSPPAKFSHKACSGGEIRMGSHRLGSRRKVRVQPKKVPQLLTTKAEFQLTLLIEEKIE